MSDTHPDTTGEAQPPPNGTEPRHDRASSDRITWIDAAFIGCLSLACILLVVTGWVYSAAVRDASILQGTGLLGALQGYLAGCALAVCAIIVLWPRRAPMNGTINA